MRIRYGMRRKVHLRKKHVLYHKKEFQWTRRKFVFFLIGTFILCVILIFIWIQHTVNPILLRYGESEIQKISKAIMNASVNQQVTENLDVDELFIISKNNDGEINTIDFDPVIVNRVLSMITANVQTNLKLLEDGKIDEMDVGDVLSNYDQEKLREGVVYQIPSGVVFGNSLLANLGPKMPVRLNLYGDISSEIQTTITNYGINNAMLEASVVMTLEERVILPFVSKQIKIESRIPIAMKLIRGNIPEYYFNGIDNNSPSITVPNN